jgi:hypothetical protein
VLDHPLCTEGIERLSRRTPCPFEVDVNFEKREKEGYE